MAEENQSGSEKELRKELDSIYTPLAEAEKEIKRRWKDKKLQKKISEFFNGNIPYFLRDEPKAYFARQIITPNFEFFNFIKSLKGLKLDFVCPEIKEDYFSAKNSCKYHLGKLFFNDGGGKRGGMKLKTCNVINFNQSNGKKLCHVETLWGENLIDFHHRILGSVVPDIEKKIFDISEWKKKESKSFDEFYLKFLAFFICNAILFENFLVNKEERHFTKNVVLPSFYKLNELFGVRPLIVRSLPHKEEESDAWFYYPGFIENTIKNQLIIKK